MTIEPTDTWETRDLPLLRTIVAMRDAEPGHPITSHALAEAAAVTPDQARSALQNLGAEFVILKDASSMAQWDVFVIGVTAEGLRAAGAWPSPETAADRLLAAIDEQISVLPEGSPRSSKLKAARDGLLGAGRDVLVSVAAAVLTGRIPV